MDALNALERLLAFTGAKCDAAQFVEIQRIATPIRDALEAHQEAPVVNLPLVIPPVAADLGQFELSAYELGITRHEVAAAALDRIMARDFAEWGSLHTVDHPRLAALEAWAYANSLFEVEHATEEQPS